MSESASDIVSSDPGPETAPVPEPRAGSQLLEARERLGLSVADVARHLKLHPRQVESLERDDYAGLPGPVFVRGFMRNYARLVGIDADGLVSLAERLGGLPAAARNSVGPTTTSGTEMPASLRTPLEKSQGKKGWLPVTVVLILVAAGIVYYNHTREVAPPPPPPPVAAEAPAPVAPEAQPPGVPVAAESPAPQGAGTPEVAVPPPVSVPAASGTPSPVQKPAESAPAAQNPAETPKTPPTPKPATPSQDAKPSARPETGAAGAIAAPAPLDPSAQRSSGGPEIRLSFSRESWVEVRDSSGSVIFSQLNPAGTERVVRGQPPFQVTVGNAGGVSVRYNSREIDLGPASRTDVAHITLE